MMEKLLGNLKQGIAVVISAPAGTGKTTLARMLIDEFPCVSESVSCTTRPIRAGEVEDKDYHFMSEEQFNEKLEKGEFLEHATVYGHHYGTLRGHVEKKIHKGEHVLLVIDTQGAMKLKESGFNALYVFIRPPSMGELRSRLFNRKTEGQKDIEERLELAEHELTMSKHYDYIIVNDNLHHAYEILKSVLVAEEHKQERYDDRYTY